MWKIVEKLKESRLLTAMNAGKFTFNQSNIAGVTNIF